MTTKKTDTVIPTELPETEVPAKGDAVTPLVTEMSHADLKAHCQVIEDLLRSVLRIGASGYIQFKSRPDGDAYLRAVELVGDEGLRLRAKAGANRIQAGRIDN